MRDIALHKNILSKSKRFFFFLKQEKWKFEYQTLPLRAKHEEPNIVEKVQII